MSQTRSIVGCMTGTSLDGIDCALIRTRGTGLDIHAEIVRVRTEPLGDLGPRLRALADQHPHTAREIADLALDFAYFHRRVLTSLMDGATPDLICIHGQTVYHKPPVSWQFLQPAPIADAFRCPVVFDLRQADLARGGQGAPITPIADWILFRGVAEDEPACALNLGGFCNYTLLDRDPAKIAAGDLCACNQLLDGVARAVLRTPYDADGAAASRGTAHDEALEDLLGVLRAQGVRGRSLGTGDELLDWVARFRHAIAPDDLAATACTGIAEAIAERLTAMPTPPGQILLAGGGARNHALVRALASACPGRVRLLSEVGTPIEAREAVCFAVLGALCQDRVPITLPQVTGCTTPAPISGCWCLP